MGILMLGHKRVHQAAFTLLMLVSATASAAGGAHLLHMDVDLGNEASLQRGAKTFVNYCLSCHSASYMRYNRMGKDLGISDDVLKANFMFGTDKVGDTMTVSMDSEDSLKFFGVSPPDLSVIARARGADWLYSYFKTFYLDENRPFGVNNLTFKDVGMPHVLWELQGVQRLAHVESEDGAHHTPTYADLELITPGTQTEKEYDQTIRDLVNFMVYLGEPIKLKRGKIGVWVLLNLIVFMIIAYMLKKEYWRDVH
jgi:ubiquinol-cytochrome c reductase cytochrome c1 subunit